MTDDRWPSVAVDATCLDCGGEVLRTETDPGQTITIPAHTCTKETDHG